MCRPANSYAAEGNPFAANFSPRRRTAQAIRASLLASATTATFLWTRASRPLAVAGQQGDLSRRRHVPEPRGGEKRCGDNGGTVRRESRACHRALVAAQDGDLGPRRRVPKPRRLVPGGGDDAGAVRV